MRKIIRALLLLLTMTGGTALAMAQNFASPAEARAMLDKAAVDNQGMAGDIARSFRSEPGHGLGDLFGFAHAWQGLIVAGLGADLVETPFPTLVGDPGRNNFV